MQNVPSARYADWCHRPQRYKMIALAIRFLFTMVTLSIVFMFLRKKRLNQGGQVGHPGPDRRGTSGGSKRTTPPCSGGQGLAFIQD
jgi:hypothetical protein